MTKRVDFIVIEDEENICKEYQETVKEFSNLFLVGTTNNILTGIEIVKEYNPSVIILDLELHRGLGNGITFLKMLMELNLPQKPYILVATNNISRITHQLARNLGADFIFTKNQADYSVKMILETIVNFIEIGVVVSDREDCGETALKVQEAADSQQKRKNKISQELDLIGISSKLKGRDYLSDAIEITCEKRTANLSALIAQKYNKTDASVERAMQTAINHAWRNTDIDTLSTYYTAYINPKKGVPTITEFIYYYADKVKKNI